MRAFAQSLARVLVALIFILSGISKITGFSGTLKMMASVGIPATTLALVLTILVEVGGGIALLLGLKARWAALLLFLYMIPVTLMFHAAHIHDPGQGQMQMIQVLKNLAIMGGLLKFVTDGAGAWSVDASG